MRVVIPSLNYGDHLAATLPAWVALFGVEYVTVVTSIEDDLTQRIASHEGVSICVTEAWKKDGAHFNKAAALDVAFDWLYRDPGEVCISIDADVLPEGRFPILKDFRFGTIYGCKRRESRTWKKYGERAREHFPDCPEVVCGYFQLFRYESTLQTSPGVVFGSYPAANEYDAQFAFRFRHAESLPGFWVQHLGVPGRDWKGRKGGAT